MKTPRKWKFLFVSVPFGGIEVFTKNVQRIVQERDDIEASWIWVERQPSEFFVRIPPISCNWTLKGGCVARSRVKKLERTGKQFDAVFFNHPIASIFLSEFRKRIPMILSLDVTPRIFAPYSKWYSGRSMSTEGIFASFKRYLTQAVYNDAIYIQAWSDLIHQSLIHDYGVNENKIKVIPPGIDLKLWSGLKDKKKIIHGAHDPKKILFVGADFIRKGGDLLLRLVQRKEFAHCEFHFVTKSFEGPISKNVFVHQDIQPNSQELLDHYRTADVFALPTRADLSPNAICEALAFQLPVVTTNVGGLNEIIKDGKTGFLVPPDDEETFAQRLHTLLQSDELCRNFGEAGRNSVEENYDIDKNARKVIEFMIQAALRNAQDKG